VRVIPTQQQNLLGHLEYTHHSLIHSVHTMRPVATEGVVWSVCVAVGHVSESSKNSGTDRDAVGGADSSGSKEPFIRRGHHLTKLFPAAISEKSEAMRPFAELL